MSVNEFTTMTTASAHIPAWHPTACVWLGLALHSVSVGVVSSFSGWLNWYAAAAAAVAVCVWSHHLPRMLPRLFKGLVAY